MRRFRPSGPVVYFFGVSIAFLALALPHLTSPRIEWEETIVPSAAIEMLAGHQISPHFVPINISGRDWPLLFNVRGTGAVESYAMLPIFALFGANVVALRLTETLLTLLAGLLFVLASRSLFDEETSYTAAPLVLFNAVFLLNGARDGFEGAVLVQWLFLSLSLIAFSRVYRGRGEYLPWAALALGAGVYAKLHFLGIALGMSAAWAGLVATGRVPAPRPRVVLAAAACFALGCLPFAAWNLFSRGESFRLAGELPKTGAYSLVKGVGLRLLALRDYLCGVAWPEPLYRPGRWALALRAAPLAALCFAPFAGGRFRAPRAALLCLAAIVAGHLLLISSMLNLPFRAALESFRPGLFATFQTTFHFLPGRNHVLPTFPLILIAYAAALRVLVPGRALRAALVALLLLPDLWAIRAFHDSSAPAAPDAVEELAGYLDRNGIGEVVNVNDHDIGPELEFLTAGRVIPTQAVLFPWSETDRLLTAAVHRPQGVFMVTEGRALSDPEKKEAFERLLAREGVRSKTLSTFEDGKITVLQTE